MELLASGQDAGSAAWMGKGQHALPENVFEANKLMELDHGRLFFPPKEKVQDPKHSMLFNFN